MFGYIARTDVLFMLACLFVCLFVHYRDVTTHSEMSAVGMHKLVSVLPFLSNA